MSDENNKFIGEERTDDEYSLCPYCGHKHHVESEDYSEDLRDEECCKCGSKFLLRQDFSVSHLTYPDCELNGIKCDYVPSKWVGGHKFCSQCGQIEPIPFDA